jgi:hypothetical protein
LLSLAYDGRPKAASVTIEPTLRTVDHTLATSEVGVRLHEAAKLGRLDVIDCSPEPASWRSYLNIGGGLERLKPDLLAMTAVPDGEREDVFVFEVDRATE